MAPAVLIALLGAACTTGGGIGTATPLSPTDPDQFRGLLAASDAPVVVNVWASFRGVCRAAPRRRRWEWPTGGSAKRCASWD